MINGYQFGWCKQRTIPSSPEVLLHMFNWESFHVFSVVLGKPSFTLSVVGTIIYYTITFATLKVDSDVPATQLLSFIIY